MSTSQTVLQGQDTVIQAGLYMSFELGDKKWRLTLSDGRRGPSRYSAKRPRKRWAKNYTVQGQGHTKIHMVAADARTAVTFSLSPGQAHDAPEGRRLLQSLGATSRPIHLLMDRAYEGNETRQLALDLGFIPVVPPLKTRIEPWEYDREMYKRRNEVERLFRRLKGFRRIFSRFEKLDAMFLGFLSFVLVVDGLRGLC